jgi:hypothetical protein
MRDFMVGNIAVGIVVVDGKAGSEAEFTALEKLTVAVEVAQAFDVLYRLKAAVTAGGTKVPLFFMAKIDTVKIDLDPASVPAPPAKGSEANTSGQYERREKVWRDPALQALGLSSGQAGISQYVQKLMSASWPAAPAAPDAAYVVFFTKYMAKWMAYTDKSLARITMCYPWLADLTAPNADGTGGFRNTGAKGWGDTNIDRVFAHESGHIFGAPDEYAASSCSATANAGHLQIANSNCEVSNSSSVNCLMKNNKEAMCPATPGHLGWVDRNNNGILDALES